MMVGNFLLVSSCSLHDFLVSPGSFLSSSGGLWARGLLVLSWWSPGGRFGLHARRGALSAFGDLRWHAASISGISPSNTPRH